MKTEPTIYSFDDLKREAKTHWEGVRNYQARNFMWRDMNLNDPVLFYHSNCEIPGIVGIASVCSAPYPDFFAFDKQSRYYDPKSSPEKPRWYMVDVSYERVFKQTVSLSMLKADPFFEDMLVVKKGQRLSIQPVNKSHFDRICELGLAA